MKNIQKIGCVIIAIASMTAFNSCTKDGPAGPQGVPGTNGNANVNNESTTVDVSAWTWDPANKFLYTFIYSPGLTSDVVSRGAVMVYAEVGTVGSGQWTALPRVTYPSASVSLSERYTVQPLYQQVEVVLQRSDLLQEVSQTQNYRVVCISPSSRIAHPFVNLRNYQEVKQVFNLKD